MASLISFGSMATACVPDHGPQYAREKSCPCVNARPRFSIEGETEWSYSLRAPDGAVVLHGTRFTREQTRAAVRLGRELIEMMDVLLERRRAEGPITEDVEDPALHPRAFRDPRWLTQDLVHDIESMDDCDCDRARGRA
jgi:hypothetical protein